MRVTPYSRDQQLFLDINQIIPTPEAADYMIGMTSKNIEERETKTTVIKREKLRLEFWERLLSHFRENNFSLFQNISPNKDHWLNAGSGISGCSYTLIFSKREARTEFYLSRSVKEENKEIYDFLFERRDQIEHAFGQAFSWERLDDKKACRIRYSKEFDGYDTDNWGQMITWLYTNMVKLEQSFRPAIAEYRSKANN